MIAVDSLTDDAANFDFRLTGLALSCREGEAYYIPLDDAAQVKDLLGGLTDVLANAKVMKVGFNIKATILALKKYGIEVHGALFDPMLAHYLIEAEASHDISILCTQYLNYTLIAPGTASSQERMCERADQVFQLRKKLQADLEKRRHSKLMSDTEMPLVSVLANMEYEGVRIDTVALAKMSEELRVESERVQREIFQMSLRNLYGSPKQLGEIYLTAKAARSPRKRRQGNMQLVKMC